MAGQMSEYQRRKMRIDEANLVVSTIAMAAAVAALSLNKRERESQDAGRREMAKRIDPSVYSNRRDMRRAARAEIKRAAVTEFGYPGPVIVLNEERGYPRVTPAQGDTRRSLKKRYASGIKRMAVSEVGYSGPVLVPNGKPKASPQRRWVAMEMNRRTGGDIQAVVCDSKAEAQDRAEMMKLAHRNGSARARDCIQGYALMSTSRGIDVAGWLEGRRGVVYRV